MGVVLVSAHEETEAHRPPPPSQSHLQEVEGSLHIDREYGFCGACTGAVGSGAAVLVSEEQVATNNGSLLFYSLEAGRPDGSPQLSP